MEMTNSQAIRFALTPGHAEELEHLSNCYGNLAWLGMAKAVKYSRNALYFSAALTTVAGLGAVLSGANHTTRQYACAAVAVLGAGLSALSAKGLYNDTLRIQLIVNAPKRT